MSRGPVRRLFRVFEKPPSTRDAVEMEIRHHIEERAEILMESDGMSREEALAEAERRFGDLRRLRREMEASERQGRRDGRRAELIRQTISDARFALRGLRKSPGLAAVVILTLTLGIGLNTAIFSLVKGVLLDPLPYPDADRIVWGVGAFSGNQQAAVSPPDYLDYREQSTSFEYLGGRRGAGSYTLTGFDRPEIVRGQEVTAEFFEALGAVPVVGRGFDRQDEEQVTRIVVLDHAFWQSRFGGRPDAIGQTLTIEGEPREVVGVMPAGFQLFSQVDFWSPIPLHVGGNTIRRFHNLRLVGKLREGVTLEQAQAELDVIAARLERQYPESNATWRLPIVPLDQVFVSGVRTLLLMLWAAVGLVLLIVCANIANLLLARGAARRSELAVRTALGASRGRVVRLLFAESVTLALVGGLAGVGLSIGALRIFKALDPGTVPRIAEIGVDGWALAFAVGASILTGLVFGLAPTLSSTRRDLAPALRDGGWGGTGSGGKLRSTLVVAEVAMSFVLLIGAGLLLQSFMRLTDVDPGFEPAGTVVGSISLPSSRYEDGAARIEFFRRVRERLAAEPGVLGVATGSQLPLTGGANDTYVGVPGRLELGSDQQFNSQFRVVSTDYFDVMGMSLGSGRPFDEGDRDGANPVVIVNQPFVDAIFPDEDPVGQKIAIDLGDPHEAEIVGVVGAVSHFSLGSTPGMHLYLPFDQAPIQSSLGVVIRTSVDPSALLVRVPDVVAELDPLLPVARLSTYEDVVARGLAQPRFQTLLLGLFAAVALLLAIIGVYGVLSYLVARRSREVGIRMALGASTRDVVGLVVRRGVGLTAAGLAIGTLLAFWVTRYMTTLLYGVTATDTVTFIGVATLLGGTSFAASYLPARQAARVDPTVTLRQE